MIPRSRARSSQRPMRASICTRERRAPKATSTMSSSPAKPVSASPPRSARSTRCRRGAGHSATFRSSGRALFSPALLVGSRGVRRAAPRPLAEDQLMLDGKRLLITGVLTRGSIAFEVARQAQDLGAEITLTSFGRARRLTERAAKHLPIPPDVLELDVNNPAELTAVADEISRRWGSLDGLLHAIAFAPADALGGGFLDTPAQSAITAFETSAFSFKALAAALLPLLEAAEGGGAVVGLDFDAAVAWPVYDWMGGAKAALESVSRYLARDLGPRGIRVNLVSAGPIETIAARRVSRLDTLGELLRVCFLLSDLSRAITGEIIHVDGGFHAMGAPLGE